MVWHPQLLLLARRRRWVGADDLRRSCSRGLHTVTAIGTTPARR
jgi:hypothetical protein